MLSKPGNQVESPVTFCIVAAYFRVTVTVIVVVGHNFIVGAEVVGNLSHGREPLGELFSSCSR